MRTRIRARALFGGAACAFTIASAACTPRLSPLAGAPVPTSKFREPRLPPGHHKIVFNWELEDREMSGRGDGAARIASPDSARLDFFLAGGFGGGARS